MSDATMTSTFRWTSKGWELGYVNGQTVVIDFGLAQSTAQLAQVAAELIEGFRQMAWVAVRHARNRYAELSQATVPVGRADTLPRRQVDR